GVAVFPDVVSDHGDLITIGPGEFRQMRHGHPAGPAPGRPEFDDIDVTALELLHRGAFVPFGVRKDRRRVADFKRDRLVFRCRRLGLEYGIPTQRRDTNEYKDL